MPLELAITQQGSAQIVSVTGMLTNDSAQHFDETVSREIHHNSDVVVDLSGLTLISSAGLRSLLQLAKSIQDRKRRLVLASVQPQVETVLKMTGLDRVFRIGKDVDAGL